MCRFPSCCSSAWLHFNRTKASHNYIAAPLNIVITREERDSKGEKKNQRRSIQVRSRERQYSRPRASLRISTALSSA